MMADDGLLINFAPSDSPLSTKQTFTGGSWRDRLKAKKIENWRQSRQKAAQGEAQSASENIPTTADPTGNGGRDDPQSGRPSKRQRLDPQPGNNATTKWHGNDNKVPSAKSASSKHREVISSLFSYNPTAKTVAEKPVEDVEPAKPTNAPLVDGLDTFTSLGVSPILAAHLLTKLHMKAPTAIQSSSISQLLKGDSDAFIQAETGSGKTLAYLLPLVQRIMDLSKQKTVNENAGQGSGAVHRDSGLFAIILAPTRELCKQISVVLESLLRCAHWIVAGTVIGGEKKKSEKARLRKGLNILVGTPGRLADHLKNTKALDVRNVSWLVLDEGDQLMDMGFEEEIQGIVKKLDARRKTSKAGISGLPEKRTTILCSATMKMNVQRLGDMSLKDAVLIKPDESLSKANRSQTPPKQEPTFSAPAQLKQSYIIAAAKLRLVTLAALLKRLFLRKGAGPVTKAIVFFSCADSVDFHFELFTRPAPSTEPPTPSTNPALTTATSDLLPTHLSVSKLHGSLPQALRTSTLQAFTKSFNPSVLLSTDLSSRGLDLPHIDVVVEYDPPFDLASHIHRIGRTARVGRPGHSILFLLPGSEEAYIEHLESKTKVSLSALSTSEEALKRGFGSPGLGGGKDWEDRATQWQLDVERWVLDSPRVLESARRAFQSHVRAYATHIASERQMFDMKALHLGHLAKSFGLRDRPANIKVPGMRASGESVRKGFKEKRGAGKEKDAEVTKGGVKKPELSEAAKMRAKMRRAEKAEADEFNIA